MTPDIVFGHAGRRGLMNAPRAEALSSRLGPKRLRRFSHTRGSHTVYHFMLSIYVPQFLIYLFTMNGSHHIEAMKHSGQNSDDEKHAEHAGIAKIKDVNEEATMATLKEHRLTVRHGLKAYSKAIGWSILLSSAVIMEGYDTILVCLVHSFDSRA